MRAGTQLLWMLFSFSGILISVLITGVWMLATRGSRASRRAFAAVLVFYALVGYYPLTSRIAALIERGYDRELKVTDLPAGRTAVVLLGSGSYTLEDWQGRAVSIPDPTGTERVLEAARVFKLLHATHLISSGGRVVDEDTNAPAAVSMETVLQWLGVPGEQIVLERESRNTHDEAVVVARMLPALDVQHVVVVTSAIHMHRSVAAFRAAGVQAFPAPAFEREWYVPIPVRVLPSEDGFRQASMAAHELAGLVYYKLRGWI